MQLLVMLFVASGERIFSKIKLIKNYWLDTNNRTIEYQILQIIDEIRNKILRQNKARKV